MLDDLKALVAEEIALPVDPRITVLAAAVAARHPGARAVLFYGSCLREARLDGLMLDFYLIVADYAEAFGKRWLAAANRLLPPNVFPIEADGLAAKYAVLSEADFARLNRPAAESVSVWARFAQPSRLVWAADDAARVRAVAAIAEAPTTLFELTLPMVEADPSEPVSSPSKPAIEKVSPTDASRRRTKPLEPSEGELAVWRHGFALTYRAELRAERNDRSGGIVDTDPARYARFGKATLAALSGRRLMTPATARRRWRRLVRNGKLLTLARLAKASLTFAGGIDYLAWKINRHAGAGVTIRPWQRRHPILGALTLLPRLIRRGSIR